jgi:hypothetical protein
MKKHVKILIALFTLVVCAGFFNTQRAEAALCQVNIPTANGVITVVVNCNAVADIANKVNQSGGNPNGDACYIVGDTVTPGDCATFAAPVDLNGASNNGAAQIGEYTCGSGDSVVRTSINIGCTGQGNPAVDLLFAVLRFMVAGVGVVVIASVIVGGIQYSTSQGEPQKQAAARGRVVNALLALLLYLFIFAILQWLVPGGIFV